MQGILEFSAGLLVARLVFGLVFAAHGAQKLAGWFGGYGLAGTGGFFEQIGFRPGRLFAALAGTSELLGGLLIALGFLGPLGSTLAIAVMVVATVTVHWGKGLFAATNGIEVPLLYATAAAALALTGPGAFSIDALLGFDAFWSPALGVAAIVAGVIGGAGNLSLRRRAPVVSAVNAKAA